MLFALAWQDHAVIVVYVLAMLAMGAWLSRRQTNDEEYFLAGRRMPWFAVGLSVIASLLSSLTYLSEPGEVWQSGTTHLIGKLSAIPLEIVFVWLVSIPFLMRFRYVSAYEYLEHRFGSGPRRLGVVIFLMLVLTWMGIIVLESSRALATVSGIQLWMVISTVGVVATFYTMLGGLRAVIWTDVIQVVLLIGGALFVVVFVAVKTGSWLPQWYAATSDFIASHRNTNQTLPLFSFSPFERATVVTVALNMLVWHICTHTANQMTVQRYFSTKDLRAARRSFITGSLFGVGINLLLMTVGMSMLYYYMVFHNGELPSGIDVANRRTFDKVFPLFAVHRLPPGVAGALLAAMLAAGMSSIDSGINSVATVLIEEWDALRGHRRSRSAAEKPSAGSRPANHVHAAQIVTMILGLITTVAAFGLDRLPGDYNIVEMMPRSFNCFTGPLGAMFLAGMFIPWCGPRAIVAATLAGLAASIGMAYGDQIYVAIFDPAIKVKPISFTWVQPVSLSLTLLLAAVFGMFERPVRVLPPGLTWFSPPPANPS